MTRRARWQVPAGFGALLLVLTVVSHATGSTPDRPIAVAAAARSSVAGAVPAASPTSTSVPPTSTSATAPRVAAAGTQGMAAVAADREQRSSTSARALLIALPEKGRAPMTGYARSQFGPAWDDANGAPSGHNGCDTRNDVLRRDLTQVVIKAGTDGCVVAAGTLLSPYTAGVIAFRRGPDSAAVQIDHVVSLGDAWQTGAQRLSASERIDLANDPLNLLAVDAHSNEAKSDGDAATWLPANKAYRCAYVARQIAVKAIYHLWVTAVEASAMQHVLDTCRAQTVPQERSAPRISVAPAANPTTATAKPHPVQHSTAPRRAAPTRTHTSAAHASCTTTSSGSCIRGGEFCKQAAEGETGYDANGRAYVCRDSRDNGHPQWVHP